MNSKNNILMSKNIKIIVRPWFDPPIKVYETIILYKMYFDRKLTNMGLVENQILKFERTKLPLLV